jgi:hypothetical protein
VVSKVVDAIVYKSTTRLVKRERERERERELEVGHVPTCAVHLPAALNKTFTRSLFPPQHEITNAVNLDFRK